MCIYLNHFVPMVHKTQSHSPSQPHLAKPQLPANKIGMHRNASNGKSLFIFLILIYS